MVEIHRNDDPQKADVVLSNGAEQGSVKFRLEVPAGAPQVDAVTAGTGIARRPGKVPAATLGAPVLPEPGCRGKCNCSRCPARSATGRPVGAAQMQPGTAQVPPGTAQVQPGSRSIPAGSRPGATREPAAIPDQGAARCNRGAGLPNSGPGDCPGATGGRPIPARNRNNATGRRNNAAAGRRSTPEANYPAALNRTTRLRRRLPQNPSEPVSATVIAMYPSPFLFLVARCDERCLRGRGQQPPDQSAPKPSTEQNH